MSAPEAITQEGVTSQDILEFSSYAPKDAYYANQWERIQSGERPRFNWPAALFGHLWWFYRRLWGWGALIFLVQRVLLAFYASADRHGEIASMVLCLWLSFSLQVLAGFFANHIYLRDARDAIVQGRARQRLPEMLRVEGGTSAIGLAVGMALGQLGD